MNIRTLLILFLIVLFSSSTLALHSLKSAPREAQSSPVPVRTQVLGTTTVRLYINPATNSASVGGTVSVQVRADSASSTVNAVQANISYPAASLDVVSVDTSSSAFTIQAEQILTSGNIRLARGNIAPLSGDNLVGVINFKVKSASISPISITFDTTSSLLSNTTPPVNILTNTLPATISVSVPVSPTAVPTPARTPTPILTPTTSIPQGTGSLSLSPTVQTVDLNTDFTVEVYENSGTTLVNAVQTNLSYPSALLDVVSVDSSTSAFSIQAQQILSSGSIQLARGTTTPVNGNKIVAKIHFKGKAAGSAPVSFTTGSTLVSSTTNTDILGTKLNGIYTISGTATNNTIGNTAKGPQLDENDANFMNGSRFMMGSNDGMLQSMSVLVGNVDSAPHNKYQVAVYSDVNGKPGILLAKSGTGILNPNAWNTIPITTALQANTSYWLMYNTNGTNTSVNNMLMDQGSERQAAWGTNGQKFGSWPTNFGPTTYSDNMFSIYGTYTTNSTTPTTTNWRGEYFNNKSFLGTPTVTREDDAINFDWSTSSPMSGIPADRFSVRWTKQENFGGGTYKFTVSNDDGMRIFVDGQRIYSSWHDQAAKTRTFKRKISAGNHTIKVMYYENRGQAVAKVSWEPLSTSGSNLTDAISNLIDAIKNIFTGSSE